MALPRLHLFEVEDFAWLPRIVRDYATDYLQFAETTMKMHRPVVPLLQDLLRESGTTRVIDLCSGGSGPWSALVPDLRDRGVDVQVCLTDRFPNLGAFERARDASDGAIDFIAEPVDALHVPAELHGVRTVFNAFHHFRPEDGEAIIRGAVEARQPIGIFEISERTLPVLLQTLLAPVMVLLATPMIRPFRWSRLLLTYLLPAIPATCLWDGVVSQLRAYTPEELLALAEATPWADYEWRCGKVRVGDLPLRLTYLIGRPR